MGVITCHCFCHCCRGEVKFMFSKKATKIDEIFIVYLTVTTYGEDFVNFCSLLRKHELYQIDSK